MSKADALVMLEKLRHAWHPPPELQKATLEVYGGALADIEPAVLAAACIPLAKKCRFWPSISEIREVCLEISGEKANLPLVGEAYAEARRAASSIGSYSMPTGEDFSHAIVHRAAIQSAGSWRRWCLAEEEAPLRARFFEHYRELRAREFSRLALPESARVLSAEESKQLLADIETRAERETKRLPVGAAGEPAKPLSELMRLNPPFRKIPPVVVGESLSDPEFESKKADLLEQAKELA